ncbi:MAG: hypothetical protein ABSE52_11190 [Candidatus Dormibacteria bacterium]
MRTIRTGSGEGTTAVALNVDAAAEDGGAVVVDDAGGALVAAAVGDATAADADARSCLT